MWLIENNIIMLEVEIFCLLLFNNLSNNGLKKYSHKASAMCYLGGPGTAVNMLKDVHL